MKWLILSSLLFAACGGKTPASRTPDEQTGCGTDEHWRTFDDQEPSVVPNDATGPTFTAPALDAVLPAAMKQTFAWNQDPNDPGVPGGDVAHVNGPGCSDCCPEYNLGALTTLHLPPISGNVYDLQFSTDGTVTHRVITTLQEWGPPDAVWAAWKGKRVSVKIYRMTLISNDVRPGVGGPFVATKPFTFSVGS